MKIDVSSRRDVYDVKCRGDNFGWFARIYVQRTDKRRRLFMMWLWRYDLSARMTQLHVEVVAWCYKIDIFVPSKRSVLTSVGIQEAA